MMYRERRSPDKPTREIGLFGGAAAPLEIAMQGHPDHMEALRPLIGESSASQSEIQVSLIAREPIVQNILAAFLKDNLPDMRPLSVRKLPGR